MTSAQRPVPSSPFYSLLLGAAFLCALLRFDTATANGVKTPPFERAQLGNGVVLLLMERHDVPLIAFNAVLRGGAVCDPPQQLGMASLLAGLLEKGADERDALRFAETIAAVGGSIETNATTESIHVSGSFLARDHRLMVELLADMLQRPRLEQEQFEALRARHIEFIRAAKDSDLASLTPIYGAASLFGAHPYGRSVFGSEASLASLTHDDLKKFYQEQIGADRLIVAVAGDFKAAQLKQTLSRAFSSWRKAQAAPPALPAATKLAQRRVLLVDAPESVQAYFWAGNIAVARNDPRRATLDVVNTLFGGRFTSMLNSELRIRTGLSYGASSQFERLSQSGHWQMSSFTRTETTAEAIDLALATLDKLHQGAIDETSLVSGRNYVQGQFPLAFETSSQWAYQLANLEFYGLPRSYIDGYSAALDAVTLPQAKTVVEQAVPVSGELALVVVGNAAAIRDSLRKYGPITEMKLSDETFAAPAQGQ